MKHTVKVGDIFTDTWGWEQTNVDCYQVVALKGATMLELRAIEKKQVKMGEMSGRFEPVKDTFKSEHILRKKVGREDTLRMDYGWARKWDGRDFYVSWYA